MLGQPPAHVMLVGAKPKIPTDVKNSDTDIGLALADYTLGWDGHVWFDRIVPGNAHITFVKAATGNRPDDSFVNVASLRLFAVTEIFAISPERVGKGDLT